MTVHVFLPMQLHQHDAGVQELQYRLVFLGNHSLVATATFDEATEAAVREYQHRLQREETGVVDHELWEHIVRDSDHAGYRPPQTMEGSVVERDTELENQMRIDFNHLAEYLQAQADLQMAAIESAYDYFVDAYVPSRLDEISQLPSDAVYAKYLTRHFVSEGGKRITDHVKDAMAFLAPEAAAASWLVQGIWIGASMLFERAAGNGVLDAVADQPDVATALRSFKPKVRDALRVAKQSELERIRREAVQAIVDAINNHDQLDETTLELARRIYKGGPEHFAAVLHEWYHVPGDLEALRHGVYEELVRRFEAFVLEVAPLRRPKGETYHEQEYREFQTRTIPGRVAHEAAQHLPPGPFAQPSQ